MSKAQLEKLGFNSDASGEVWSKDDIQADDTKPQAAIPEPDVPGAEVAAQQDEEDGEGGFRYCTIIHSYRTHSIDYSNFSVKTIEDCLSSPSGRKKYGLGVFPDDSPEFCDQPIHLYTKVQEGHEKTEIEVLKYKI